MKKKLLVICCLLFVLTGCKESEDISKEVSSEVLTEEVTKEDTEIQTEENIKSEEEIAAEEQAKKEAEFQRAKMLQRYEGVLNAFLCGMLPDGTFLEVPEFEDGGNQFAICDVDGDGREELVINYIETSTAGMLEVIYDYNAEQDEVMEQYRGYPGLTFYENGAMTSGWSHNQGLGNKLWPFDLYKYDSATDSYICVGFVDTWDSEREEDYEGNPFPKELDKDGDGTIYMIESRDTDSENWEYNKEKSDFEAWLQAVTGGTSEIELPMQNLTYENISPFADTYMELLINRIAELQTKDFDFGFYFMKEMRNIEELEAKLSEKFNMQLVDDSEDSFLKKGIINGSEIYECYHADTGAVTYKDTKVEGLTLMGLYPGMSAKEATSILNQRGFFEDGDSFYVTGDGTNNYYTSFIEENGMITSITFGHYTKYR